MGGDGGGDAVHGGNAWDMVCCCGRCLSERIFTFHSLQEPSQAQFVRVFEEVTRRIPQSAASRTSRVAALLSKQPIHCCVLLPLFSLFYVSAIRLCFIRSTLWLESSRQGRE
jgi:hypothetical protein